jgi:hypothetical protein
MLIFPAAARALVTPVLNPGELYNIDIWNSRWLLFGGIRLCHTMPPSEYGAALFAVCHVSVGLARQQVALLPCGLVLRLECR